MTRRPVPPKDVDKALSAAFKAIEAQPTPECLERLVDDLAAGAPPRQRRRDQSP